MRWDGMTCEKIPLYASAYFNVVEAISLSFAIRFVWFIEYNDNHILHQLSYIVQTEILSRKRRSRETENEREWVRTISLAKYRMSATGHCEKLIVLFVPWLPHTHCRWIINSKTIFRVHRNCRHQNGNILLFFHKSNHSPNSK